VETKIAEIADGIYRLSTYVPQIAPPAGFAFNSFLIRAEQPLLFHTGLHKMFSLNVEAVAKLMPVAKLRWIAFGHYEADECGAMNEWLAAAPKAEVVYSPLGCDVSVRDLADRPPRALAPDETLELGDRTVRLIATPHVPHGWEAQILYEEITGTLFCGDLFTHVGDPAALTAEDIVSPALAAEDMFGATSIGPHTAPTIRGLADLRPKLQAAKFGRGSMSGSPSARAPNSKSGYRD